MPPAAGERMRRNVRLYPWFLASSSISPWLPIFFLFFSQRVGFDGALTLSAVFYAAVVVLEVPSGYLSDRVGRVPTLAGSALLQLAAYAVFVAADSLPMLALGQTLMAAGLAFRSGSDSALLHDSLAADGRQADYGPAEARAGTVSMCATGLSCLVGGLLGSVDLALPYALGGLAAAISLFIATRFIEPPLDRETASTVGEQARQLAGLFGDRVLLWLFAFHVLAFTLAHVPFEFYQPWLRLLGDTGEGAWLAGGEKAPVVSGVVFAFSMFGGAVGSWLSIRIADRLGLPQLLLLANAVQLLIIGGLALALHPALLVLVLSRNFAMAMSAPPALAAIAPRLAAGQRATWLSLQSLAGRLGFSLVLFALSGVVATELQWQMLRAVLLGCVGVGAVLALLLWWVGARTGSDTGTVPERPGAGSGRSASSSTG